ncbi:MAG: hypothetical protein ACC662_05340 [Planctomycetota bacterium]
MRWLLVLMVLTLGGAVLPWWGRPVATADGEKPRPVEVRTRVAAWLDDLSSDAFKVREAARRGLEKWGGEARDLLEGRRDDPDPEVRRTVRRLLVRLGRPRVAGPSSIRDFSDLGLVRLHAEDTLRALLLAVARSQGARIEVPAGKGDAATRIDLDGVPFFDAVAKLAGEAGLAPVGAFDAAGRLRLEDASTQPRVPWAGAGPMRVRVAEVTATRVLAPEPERRYVVAFDLDWSPAVQLVSYRTPRILLARDVGGHGFRAGAALRTNTTWGVSSGALAARMTIPLEPEGKETTERLAELSFELPVRLRHDRRQVRFVVGRNRTLPETRVVAGREGLSPGGEGSVTLRSVGRPDGGRGPWVVELSARLGGGAAAQSLQVLLEGADGTLHRSYGGSRFPAADGQIELTARTYGRWAEAPVAVRVYWFGAESEGSFVFRLKGVPLR